MLGGALVPRALLQGKVACPGPVLGVRGCACGGQCSEGCCVGAELLR